MPLIFWETPECRDQSIFIHLLEPLMKQSLSEKDELPIIKIYYNKKVQHLAIGIFYLVKQNETQNHFEIFILFTIGGRGG